ncbi:unnamed protein product [Echinostoma caproni]|uniref:RunxI domain-containing protein n=1 Tax=Echinostoma caproni TaxID=27848 RepID=A0A183B4Z6_9TREM|nr:unnamed protein product [Echinostoma caproni]
MAASVLGLTSTPNSYRPFSDGRNGTMHSPVISMESSQNLGMSMNLMHSSLLHGDMGSVLCTQSFHPSLTSSSPKEPRTSFSLTIPPRLRTIHQIVMQYTSQVIHGRAFVLSARRQHSWSILAGSMMVIGARFHFTGTPNSCRFGEVGRVK